MINYEQTGRSISRAPTVAVASGVGFMFGTALFGVAKEDVALGVVGPFQTEGIITIAKTSALAITAGDRLFWDAANRCVNKTLTSQVCVGVAVTDAANPSPTVQIKLGAVTAAGV